MNEQNAQPTGRAERREPSPFAPASSGASRSAARWIVATGGIAAAVVAAWWFTRAARVAEVGAALPAAGSGRQAVMLSSDAARRIGVTYAVVERGSITAELRTVGIVAYDETRLKTIAPKVDGYVDRLFVSFTGQAVEQGDPLLSLYSPMLVSAQEELLLAKKLVVDVSGANADAAQNAETLLASARRRLRYWDVPDADVARIEQTGQVQKSLTLRSPLGGVVVQKNVQSGQRIMAGDAVYQVADLHEVWLEGEVFERDLGAMRLGQSVVAEFATMPGRPRAGRIVYIASNVNPDTRTTQVRVSLANHDMSLKPGMYATIRIRGEARTNALSVPRSAVLVTGQRVLVFVKGADGMLTPREVDLGASTDERVEILRGLKAGETVVSSATFLVDAESNLGSALAAMAAMPGMDHGAPKGADTAQPKTAQPKTAQPKTAQPKTAQPPAAKPDPMANMPGMNHGPTKKP